MKFYVYIHYRLDNDEIFYVGKGSNNRAYSKLNRNTYWHNIVNKYGYRVEILKSNLQEEEAFIEECKLIKSLNPCTNLTKGGNGGDTFSKLPEQDKQRLREEARKRASCPNSGINKAARMRKGKSKENCEALRIMSEKNSIRFSGSGNPMYGRSHWHNKAPEEKERIKSKTSESLKKRYKEIRRIYDKVKCPHCGKIGGKPGMTRYHFNKCKYKS